MKNANMRIHLMIITEKLILETSMKKIKVCLTEKLILVLEKQLGEFLMMEFVVQLMIQIFQANSNLAKCQEKIVPTAQTSPMTIAEK